MNVWPPQIGPGTIAHHTANARRLRAEAFNAAFRKLARGCALIARYAVAPTSAASKSGHRFCVRLRSLVLQLARNPGG